MQIKNNLLMGFLSMRFLTIENMEFSHGGSQRKKASLSFQNFESQSNYYNTQSSHIRSVINAQSSTEDACAGLPVRARGVACAENWTGLSFWLLF